MTKIDQAILNQLARPFGEDQVSWKPQATTQDKKRALAVAYIDARLVAERLDEAAGGDWEFDWEEARDHHVKGILTVCGTTRCDVGEEGNPPLGNTLKAAVSDSLKRCAVLFGVGRYLYRVPAQWVDYDGVHKKLSKRPTLPTAARPSENHSNEPEKMRRHHKPASRRPYPPETVKKGILSRAARGNNSRAKDGLRGLVVDWLERIWLDQNTEVKTANRHSILNFIFGDPSSKQLTTGRCNAVLAWLTDRQENGKLVLNPYATAEANAIVATWNEAAGQQRLGIPSGKADTATQAVAKPGTEQDDLPF